MTLATDNSSLKLKDKDNLAIADTVVKVDKSKILDTIAASNLDDNSPLVHDAKTSKFRHPSTRNELASYYLHFMGPKPFYKSYSYV